MFFFIQIHTHIHTHTHVSCYGLHSVIERKNATCSYVNHDSDIAFGVIMDVCFVAWEWIVQFVLESGSWFGLGSVPCLDPYLDLHMGFL